MYKPVVRINTLIQDQQLYVDPISKFFIIAEMIFGLNRLLLFRNIKSFWVIFGYAFSFLVAVTFYVITFSYIMWQYFPIITIMDMTSFSISIGVSSILWKRLRNYYEQLFLFDVEVGCEIKLSKRSIGNIVLSVFSVICAFAIFVLSFFAVNKVWPSLRIVLMIMKLLHTVDFCYNSHLLGLLIPRLQLVNYLLEVSYPNDESSEISSLDKCIKIKTDLQNRVETSLIINYYNKIIKAYDTLNNAIKWQLLFMFIDTFVKVLRDLYYISAQLLAKKLDTNGMLLMANIMTFQFIPMVSVCVIGDALHKEVLHLREVLACRLYEGRLDKRDRRAAQALLTLTEARNLSFSLFHMFNIDISLPFKLFSLLITYLIIMLQFDKVNQNST